MATNARLTQEFAEAAYHTQSRADLTQEFAEAAYHSPVTVTGTAILFDACGNFTGKREWEARLYTKDGKRKGVGVSCRQ